MFYKKCKGFTFVELIIVLVVLGALGGTFLINYKDNLITAKAVTIVANLRTIKDAALLYRMSTPNPTIKEFIQKGVAKQYLGDTASTKLETTDLTSLPNELEDELKTNFSGDQVIQTFWQGGVVMVDGRISYRVWSLTATKGGAELGIWKAQCNYGNQNNSYGGDPDMAAIRVKLIEMAPEARLLTEGLQLYTISSDRIANPKTNTDTGETYYERGATTYKVAIRVE